MNTSMRKRSIAALLVAGSVVLAAPVAAQAHYGPVNEDPQAASAPDSSDIVLRRDGTKSTTFVADVSPAPVLRRDGTKSTAFVADVSPGPVIPRAGVEPTALVADSGPQATASSDGFDWGAAAIGAAAGLLIALVVAAGSAATRGRAAHATTAPASQGV